MLVVFHRSAGKMIFKGFVAAIVFSFAWIKSVTGGTSYSNAYMQRGPGLNFYGPAALKTAQLTPIAATPLMSSLLPPCVSPCVVPVEQVAALAPVATSSANFVSYKAPVSVPVVVAPANDDGTSYEYSYVVYDENTGDRKAQKETSDGSVVRGQYSLVQPNGYVREVQYTADDLKGFNAVVKNFLPEVQAKALLPCPEVKSEPLKMSNEKSEAAFDLSEPQPRRKANEKLKIQPKSYKKQESLKEPERLDEPKDDKAPKSLAENAKPESKKEQGKPKGQVVNAANAGPGSADEHIIEEQKNKQKKEGNKQEEPRASQDVTGGLPGDINALVSYNDIIKCIQSAIKRTNNSLQPLASPLTYIILNKPC